MLEQQFFQIYQTLTVKSKQAREITPANKKSTPILSKPCFKLNPETRKTADIARMSDIIFEKYIFSFKIIIPKSDNNTGADKMIG